MARKKQETLIETTDEDNQDVVQEAPAPKAPKAPKEPKPMKTPKVIKVKIEQNGIARPDPGTKTGAVWDICDKISANTGKPADRKMVLDAGKLEGLNEATITTQHGRWREFHGLVNKRAPKDPIAAAAEVAPIAGVVEPVSE